MESNQKFSDDDEVCCKIRGMPFRTNAEEVMEFFAEFNPVDGSFVMEERDGRKTGWGAICFKSADDAAKAIGELDGKYLGPRYVGLMALNYGDFCKYKSRLERNAAGGDGGAGGDYGPKPDVLLSGRLTEATKEKALMMRGCPWRVQVDEIITFFDGFGTIKSENVIIEEKEGKRTGSALVIFESDEKAQEAKEAMQKKEI